MTLEQRTALEFLAHHNLVTWETFRAAGFADVRSDLMLAKLMDGTHFATDTVRGPFRHRRATTVYAITDKGVCST